MLASRSAGLFQRVDALERRLCRSLNRGCRQPAVRDLFRFVSRLGDGAFWYIVMLLLPVRFGEAGLKTAFLMAVTGVVGVGVCRVLKRRLVRERPYVTLPESTPAACRSTATASHPAIGCMPSRSRWSPSRTSRCSSGRWCHSPCWSPLRVSCSACITRATWSPARCLAPDSRSARSRSPDAVGIQPPIPVSGPQRSLDGAGGLLGFA